MVTPVLRRRRGPASSGVVRLGRGATGVVRAALDADPVASCMVDSRFATTGLDPRRLGGTFWGLDGGRRGLCFVGAVVMPLAGDAAAMAELGAGIGRLDRMAASVVGPADRVLPLWAALSPSWGPARDIRPDQPLLVCPRVPAVDADPAVRPVPMSLLDAYFPAAVAMFTEEVGTDPRAGDGGRGYRARVAALIEAGRAFARFERGQVVFKAEIGALSRSVALIQGVWVHPEWRGRGLAAPGTAAVAAAAQAMGRLPSLYVNAGNAPARAAYARAGFTGAGTFATVLF